MNADSIKIECDEDGFHLVMQLDEEIPLVTNEGRLDINVHGCSEALYEQVNLIIGGWLAEGENVRRIGAFGSGGYELSDPKHPDYHSVHADLYDNQDKTRDRRRGLFDMRRDLGRAPTAQEWADARRQK